jgi:hypothetical protein
MTPSSRRKSGYFRVNLWLMVRPMSRALLVTTFAAALALTACAPSLGPAPPGGGAPPAPPASTFRAQDFAWSMESGHGGIAGRLTYRGGGGTGPRYTCARTTVILTPETPWTRQRMEILYLSAEASALPADEVRARTPSAPRGDYSAYIRKATCDDAGRFSFAGLPDGAWYVIAAAKPVSGQGPTMAIMRRVTTRSGHVTPLTL